MPCLTLGRTINILLVDDQRAVLAGVRALIESESPSMRVVASATTGWQVLDLLRSVQPDVIVLDAHLGAEDGLALIPTLLNASEAEIVILTDQSEPAVRDRALALGARGFVQKTAPGGTLIAAILEAAKSRATFSHSLRISRCKEFNS